MLSAGVKAQVYIVVCAHGRIQEGQKNKKIYEDKMQKDMVWPYRPRFLEQCIHYFANHIQFYSEYNNTIIVTE